ncbi:MAG: multifunctional 2-oxoglutarate metabolism enzyme, partial [Micromonosporaceae bacterium]|nr:multifunctional 2-oxoglutarate metabolism enzyme [Micromonosporaceae bacterium]
MATTDSSTETDSSPAPADFGANEWLVEDMYERYLADPSSVDAAWHDFFADYRPGPGQPGASNGHTAPVTPETTAKDNAAATDRKTEDDAPTAVAKPDTQPAPKPAPKPAAAKAPQPEPKHAEKSDQPEAKADDTPSAPVPTPLRGAAARVVANMQASLSVPTATSVRAVPAKLIADNRVVINNHLRRARGGKVSFTHIIGYALVRALHDHPEMNNAFVEQDGKPAVLVPNDINLGIAIDLAGKNGSRSLVVASIKRAQTMDFSEFWSAYEDIIRRARAGKLTTEDFAGTTISLTNPGTIGTNHSVPRLMSGQGTIVGVGAMEYPAEFSGMSEEQLTDRAISKIMTLTSTYDHRII